MNLRPLFILSTLLYSTHCFALFCPTNFNLINLGDTIAQVEKSCGKPAVAKTYTATLNEPQEWTFYEPVPNAYGPPLPGQTQGSMKVSFAFVDNKVVNITSNGIGVGATTICNSVNLQLGSSIADVRGACGKPALITKSDIPGPDGKVPKGDDIVEWQYSSDPPVTLKFVNGTLTERN